MNALTKLDHFTGSENWYRHALVQRITYTDGVKYVADEAGAHWLVDIIATNQLEPKVKREEFQVWKLTVADGKGKVVCEDGNDNAVFSQDIDFTDFPEPGITMWLTDGVILLPSEY
ncbi:DUF6876 family protein [Methylobacterium sp. WL120]|uniref:DUF6876 family protein n=1 Tax=Methylobacterium sp. WL120 TaxID=2603887 RepID=UPI0011CAC19D|nr:DUF6876 family protein [Methylobacterium sp. WL120]TXM69661.1 hypothetical protein FV229_04770 [Methylobacterium sp. WL120]